MLSLTGENLRYFLSEIRTRYGYDFSGYAQSSILRRITRFMKIYHYPNLEELINELVENETTFSKFLEEITVNVTEMFRDPFFYKSLKENVIPDIKKAPHIRIWDAGCSTGEEAYSLSILLSEENCIEKSRIYATDINRKVLAIAADGIFNIRDMAKHTQNYRTLGGKFSFSNYYHAKYDRVIMADYLRRNILFSIHNLATDGSFNEFNLIVCRNVMIYFEKVLQEKVFKLFFESLPLFGYLALGNKESLALSNYRNYFEVVDHSQKIYRKIKE